MNARLPLLGLLTVVALAGAAVGCNRSGARLREAASADLNCPASRIKIIGASRTKDVNGCGHQATYKFEDGEWYMTMRDGQAYSTTPPSSDKAGPPPVSPATSASPTSAPTNTSNVTGTPSMPPSSPPPPAPGSKSL